MFFIFLLEFPSLLRLPITIV